MTGGVPASCAGLAMPGGGTWYARVTARTAVDNATIRAFTLRPINLVIYVVRGRFPASRVRAECQIQISALQTSAR
jgi:hypothetical protein